MDYAIRTLTQRWTERLTDLAGGREFLTMAEVAGGGASGGVSAGLDGGVSPGSGLPAVLVARMQQIVAHQFRITMESPVTEWAELDRPDVADAWREFLGVAGQELRLPLAYATAVVETAVSDVLEMVLQPRVAIPQALFGEKETKSLDKVRQAAELVVVNERLARAVVRYMEREGLAELSVQKAALVVQRVDEKLLEGLSDEQIVGLLEPFFELFEGDGDPAMLCLFFEDKEMMDVVRRLEEERSAVDRAGLLELMRVAREDAERGADALAFVGLGEDVEEVSESEEALVEGAESDDFVGGMEFAEEQAEISEEVEKEPEVDRSGFEFAESDEASEVEDDFVEAVHVPEEVEEPAQNEEPATEPELEEKAAETVTEPEEPEEEPDEEPEEEDEPLSIAERFAMQSGFSYDEESDEDEDDEEEVDTSVWLSGEESTEEYTEDDTSAEVVEDDSQDEDEDYDEELEKPTKELSTREHQIHIAQLSNWLAPDSDRFIESIFRGSPEAYEKAIAALSAYSGWKVAASYIKEEIFDAFEVELTDPIAADFTDGMQSYFEEFKG